MSQTVTISNFQDSYALQSKPTKNYNTLGTMALQDGAFGYLFFSNPVPPRARVLSAKLRVRNVEVWGGTITLTLNRLAAKFSASRLNWNNKPAVVAGAKTVQKSNAPAQTTWEFDITTWVQAIADGADWYGLRIDANGTTRKRIYSSQATSQTLRPQVEITWADEPQAPSDLQPRNGDAVSIQRPTLRFDFTDTIGSTVMRAYRVQFKADSTGHSVDTGFTSPTFDTGEVLSSLPQFDTSVAATRSFAVSTTSGSTTITSTANGFLPTDVGASISGTGIPAGATITAVASASSATLSAAATATGTNITGTLSELWAGLANNGAVWWTVQVQDDAGLWSKWSAPVRFTRVDKPTATIINPTTVVEESTPPFAWTMTGQVAYQVLIVDPDTNKKLWDTGYVTSTAQQITVDEGKLTTVGKLYRAVFQLYDNVKRATTPGDPPYVEKVQEFTFTPTATVSPTSNLTVTKRTDRPTYDLQWTSATMPDDFAVLMDGKVIGPNLHPADVLVSGTTYKWEARKVSGRQSHTFEVARVVNGKQSSGNPQVTVQVKNMTTWLFEKDGSNAVPFLDPVVDPDLSEESEVLYPMGAAPVLITQSQWGYVGSVSGVLTDMNLSGVTARQLRDRLLAMRKKVGQTFYLLWQDEAIECYIYNVAVQQVGNADGSTDYNVSFGFVQVDYV